MKISAHELRASIELNTPAVLGGARPRQCDPYFKLRPSSVRGGLRYWFRAAAASLLWPENGSDPAAQRAHDDRMVLELRKLEAYVFGDTERSSRVLVLPPDGGVVEPWRPIPDQRNQPGLRYLGYGLFDGKGRPPDRLVTRDLPIELRLRFRDERPEIHQAVAASLWLWTTFGGLGARGRRGYGSMQLVGLVEHEGKDTSTPYAPFTTLCTPLAKTTLDHLDRLKRGIELAQEAIKALVALSSYGRALLTNDGKRPHPNIRTIDGITNLLALHGETDEAMDALELAGSLMQGYRSSLVRKTPLPDYNAVKQSLMAPYRPPSTVDRAAFGLPLNFYFRSLAGAKTQFLPSKPVDPKKTGERSWSEEPDRLPSPLLVRVHALEPSQGQRRYGVTLVNLAGRSTTTPLLGCDLRQGAKGRDKIAPPSGRILDDFIAWAVEQSRRQPLQPRRRAHGGQRK